MVGAPGSSIEIAGATARRIPRDGSTVFEIDAELAGEATVVIVNAGRTARSVTVSASR